MRREGLAAAAIAAVVAAGCGGEESSSTPVKGEDAEPPSAAAIKPLDSTLIFLPDQTGGNFHVALVRVRNTSDKVAINVGGQLSIKDASGRCVAASRGRAWLRVWSVRPANAATGTRRTPPQILH